MQKEKGMDYIDINLGPAKKDGHELMPWVVEVVQEVVPDIPLALDTSNIDAIEAALKVYKETPQPPLINSIMCRPERYERMVPLAAEYNIPIIGLTIDEQGVPRDADGRAAVALNIIQAALEHGVAPENVFIDAVILPVSAQQENPGHVLETIRQTKLLADPPPKTIIGLSNVSQNARYRELINRTYLVMAIAAGLDAAIANPLDEKQNEVIRIVEERDTSTPVGRLLVALYDATAAMEELDPSLVDMDDPEQVAIWKTVQILMNKVIYADGYLRM